MSKGFSTVMEKPSKNSKAIAQPPIVMELPEDMPAAPPAPIVPPTTEVGPTVVVEIPIGQCDSKFPARQVSVTLDEVRAKKMRSILIGLKREKSLLTSGVAITNNADIVRWLLDQMP